MADMNSMGTKPFLKAADIQAPFEATILDVYIHNGQFGRQVIMVTETNKISLNDESVDNLKQAWGNDSDEWKNLKCTVAEGHYTNKSGEEKSKIVVTPMDYVINDKPELDQAPPPQANFAGAPGASAPNVPNPPQFDPSGQGGASNRAQDNRPVFDEHGNRIA